MGRKQSNKPAAIETPAEVPATEPPATEPPATEPPAAPAPAESVAAVKPKGTPATRKGRVAVAKATHVSLCNVTTAASGRVRPGTSVACTDKEAKRLTSLGAVRPLD